MDVVGEDDVAIVAENSGASLSVDAFGEHLDVEDDDDDEGDASVEDVDDDLDNCYDAVAVGRAYCAASDAAGVVVVVGVDENCVDVEDDDCNDEIADDCGRASAEVALSFVACDGLVAHRCHCMQADGVAAVQLDSGLLAHLSRVTG